MAFVSWFFTVNMNPSLEHEATGSRLLIGYQEEEMKVYHVSIFLNNPDSLVYPTGRIPDLAFLM
jgi:hypothetical protein